MASPLATLTVKVEAELAEFRAEFKEAAKATEKFQEDFEKTATKSILNAKAIWKAIGTVVDISERLVTAALENADAIDDLSKKTGLSIRTIQEFQEIAAQTGTSLESWTTAALNLGITLAKGGKGVTAGVEALGLSLKELNLLNQDEKFDKVTDALRDMDDQVEANRIGALLFQRQWKEVGGAIGEDLDKLKAGTRLMADDQVERLARANKAWKEFGRDVTIISGEILASIMQDVSQAADGWGMVFNLLKGRPALEGFAIPKTPEQEAFDKSFDALFKRQTAERTQAAKDAAQAAEDAAERQKKAFEKAQKAAEAYRDSIIKLRDEFSGAKLGGDVKKLEDAFGLLTEKQKSNTDVQKRVGEAAEELRQKGAALSPELLTLATRTQAFSEWLNKVPGQTEAWARSFDELRTALQKPLVQLADLNVALDQIATHKADTLLNFGEQGFNQFENFGKSFEERLKEFSEPGKWEKRFKIFGESLKDIGLRGAHTLAEGIAEGIETGDWGAVGQAFEDAMAGMMADGLAAAVDLIVPGLGKALQPIFDAISKKITGAFDFNEGRDLVQDFAKSFGGFDALHAKLLEMGAAGEALWIKLTQGVGRDNPQQAKAVIDEITKALDAFGTEAERAATRMSGIGTAIDAINTKAQAFALPFQNLLSDEDAEDVKAKLAAMGQVGQAEFERIGTFAAAAFAGLVKETGNALLAIQQLGPTFQVLQDGVTKFGLTSTGTIDALIGMFSLVNDAVTGPILQAIQTTGQIFEGLQQGGLLTAELFQTVATDIGASFRELEAKGGDVAKAMALSQPVLQRLWEAQQIYGDITDETTRSLIEQAEQQGLVGAHMRDVNQKILDVLIAIADVFGAKIPEGMRATQLAATETAGKIEDEFSRIKIPNIMVDVEFNIQKPGMPDFTVPALASGGIVRRPTLALVGESGPEAVVPLSRLGSVGGGQESTVIFEIDGRQIAAATVPYLPGEVRRYIPA